MSEVEILPLIADLIGIFFRSSRDALERACNARTANSIQGSTGLNIYPHRVAETQASLECIVSSFLTVEATINYIFFSEMQGRPDHQSQGLDKWLQNKWKRLSIYDRFVLLVNQYSTASLDDFQLLTSLLAEFITFRNRIVHAIPEQYDALIQRGLNEDEVFIHDVELVRRSRLQFSVSRFSEEIARIDSDDAQRSFEIMLLVISFLDEQFVAEFELSWRNDKGERVYRRPRDIITNLDFRYYPSLKPDSFVPESIKEAQKYINSAGEIQNAKE